MNTSINNKPFPRLSKIERIVFLIQRYVLSQSSCLIKSNPVNINFAKMDTENFEDTVQREVREAVASSQKSLMDDISGLISSTFSPLKRGSVTIKGTFLKT